MPDVLGIFTCARTYFRHIYYQVLGFAFVLVTVCQGNTPAVCMSTLPKEKHPYIPHQSREKTWSYQCSVLLFTIGPTTALMVLLALTDCFCSGFASVVMEEEKNNET